MNERPLRIAFLLPSFPEISNTFILDQITGLIRRGHELDLFAISHKSLGGAHADVERYRLATRLRHIPIPSNRWKRIKSAYQLLRSPEGRHPAMLDALNPWSHGHKAWNLVQIHTVASFLRSRPYDILHCQFGNYGPAAERLLRLGAVRAKLVTSFRGADLTSHLPANLRTYSDLLRRGDLFMPVSQDFRERLIALGAPPDRVVVHRSGIDLSRFRFRARQPPRGTVQLLFVGRLTEKKGLEYVLDAIAKTQAKRHDVHLKVIGGGPLGAQLEARCRQLGIGDRVVFLGPLTQDKVIEAMHASHVLLAPSVTAHSGDQEGIPNVLKEAMATGMPVLSTHHSGIPELIDHGINGFLAPERDSDALATLLSELLGHSERWASLGEAARRKIEDEYDSERLNDQLVASYRSLVR